MRVVEKGEHQRDGDRAQSRRPDRLDQRRNLVLRQRHHDVALGVDALGDLVAPAVRHQQGGAILEQVIQVGLRRAAQFQQVAEAAGGGEAGLRTLLLEQCVGDYGRGVREQGDGAGLDAGTLQRRADAVQYPLGQVIRGARHLGDLDAPGSLLDQRDIGERAANVDAQPPTHRCARQHGSMLCEDLAA